VVQEGRSFRSGAALLRHCERAIAGISVHDVANADGWSRVAHVAREGDELILRVAGAEAARTKVLRSVVDRCSSDRRSRPTKSLTIRRFVVTDGGSMETGQTDVTSALRCGIQSEAGQRSMLAAL